jgi:hypothetical protein
MYQKLSLEYKILWAEEQLQSCQKSVDFWTNQESEYRKLYNKKSVPEAWECAHLNPDIIYRISFIRNCFCRNNISIMRKIKQSKKAAKAEYDYWLAELGKLKNQ